MFTAIFEEKNLISRFIVVMLITLTLLVSGIRAAHAANVALLWNAVLEKGVVGYKVYYQANSSAMPFSGTEAVEGVSPIDVHGTTATTLTGLDAGKSYYFAVTAYDAKGKESAYSNVAADLDLAPPAVFISSPVGGAVVNGTVPVAASASDNVAVSKVEFYVNGSLQSSDTSTPYLFSWNTTALTTGNYTLTAKAYDSANNATTSSSVTVTVNNKLDTTAPLTSITSPVNNASVSGTIAVAAAASDAVGVSRVDFYVNGAMRASVNTTPYSYNWDTTAETNGKKTVSCKAYDAAGNTGISPDISINVNNIVPDTTAPVITAFAMPSKATSLSVSISSFAAIDAVAVTGYLVTATSLKPSAQAAGWTAAVPAKYMFSAAGNYTVYAWAKDSAGNVSASRSATVNITLKSPWRK